jgi:hypothetical protein
MTSCSCEFLFNRSVPARRAQRYSMNLWLDPKQRIQSGVEPPQAIGFKWPSSGLTRREIELRLQLEYASWSGPKFLVTLPKTAPGI